jgi:hypothetical protein
MAAFFLLLCILVVVVIGDAVVENTETSSVTLFNQSFDQLSGGQLLALFAGLGFLLALFLFLAFGSSRTRRSRRKELKSRRRDAEGRVDELERENARLRKELTGTREELESVERSHTDATAERDRAEAAADRVRAATGERNRNQPVAMDAGARVPEGGSSRLDDRATTATPEPANVQRERLDDRTAVSPAQDEHARAADEHARAADEHARAADQQSRRR